ncbi:DNA-processing protein DprA [Agromyces soli]|uniref:DNA-processing protein DprA n=1 Tax=Agromyces soli TaxID=659012 RepID=A0ABY4ASU5_9MICO|nr:DNA-processing protein DprA [Agromyces soli]UOE25231.1 DNA-processing protein DprA [Agromyces soli]
MTAALDRAESLVAVMRPPSHASAAHAGPAPLGPTPADAASRALLGVLAEPGDGTLGALVASLGAPAAAEFIASERTVGEVFRAQPGLALDPGARAVEDGLDRWRQRLAPDPFLRSLEQAERLGARMLVPGDDGWPDRLDDLGPHAPLVLWVRGDPRLVAARPSIAVVGARAATGYGEQLALETATGLVDRGCTIVSGGAYGIDGAAHRAALRRGGATVAVLAGGPDRLYPQGHAALLGEIVERGAVVSELPCGAAPTKWRFLARNRVIAALSDAVVVVEAGWRSGALNTAHHAASLGRPVGVVPGPVTSPASAGCHRLLREQEAVCVTDAAEAAELLGRGGETMLEPQVDAALQIDAGTLSGGVSGAAGRSGAPGSQAVPAGLRDVEIRLLDAMSVRAPRSVAELAARAGLEPSRALGALGTLDALGRVRRTTDGWLIRR